MHIFSKFNPLNVDTPFIRTLYGPLSVHVNGVRLYYTVTVML